MAAVRAADERTLLSQLESFLHLFQLREMMQSVEAAADADDNRRHQVSTHTPALVALPIVPGMDLRQGGGGHTQRAAAATRIMVPLEARDWLLSATAACV